MSGRKIINGLKDAVAGNVGRTTVVKVTTLRDLQGAIRAYISEVDNPVPDYAYRRTIRNRLRELAGCPAEPSRNR